MVAGTTVVVVAENSKNAINQIPLNNNLKVNKKILVNLFYFTVLCCTQYCNTYTYYRYELF